MHRHQAASGQLAAGGLTRHLGQGRLAWYPRKAPRVADAQQPEIPGRPRPANICHDGDLSPFPGEHLPPSIHGVFVSNEVSLEVSFVAARARLASLIRGGLLGRASAQAYSGEITGLARIGPLGSVPGLSKVVQVHVQELKAFGDSARFALRWEVAGPGGALFPALDADITLAPAGEQAATLTLTGVYRPFLGTAGAALDRAVLHRVAMATIRAFLHSITEAIGHPARAAEPEVAAVDPDPPSAPGEPGKP